MREPFRLCLLSLVMVTGLFSCQADDPTFNPGDKSDARVVTPRIDAGEESCARCVEPDGTCRSGEAEDACGGGGAACQVCDSEESCEELVCTPPPACSPENCSGCCDADGECLSGATNPGQCGSGGAECTQCSSGICEAGACKQTCSAATCSGCCMGPTIDDCVPAEEGGGQTDSICGVGGNTCSACTAGRTCSAGACIDASCSASCLSGCCDGSSCEPGTSDIACGSGGNACMPCASGLSCSQAGVCETDLTSLWDFVITSADVPTTDAMGDAWDPFGGAPDVRIRLEVGDAPILTGESGSISNQYFPVYSAPNGQVVIANIPAERILQRYKFIFEDVDTFENDMMAEIVEDSPTSFIFGGSQLLRSVGSDENLFTVRFKLVKR